MRTHDASTGKSRVHLEVAVHRRVLNFLNDANRAQDLVYEKLPSPTPEMDPAHDDERGTDQPAGRASSRTKILDPDIAEAIIEFRDREFPLGFRNVQDLLELKSFRPEHLDILRHWFSNRFYGSWSVFPQDIPRRGPGSYDGVVHAALLHTGKVLFITADETTLLWNPDDSTAATFEDPLNQPHQTPDAASGYSVLCGGHSFLSDGRLLVVGGGGYGPHAKARWATRSTRSAVPGRGPRAAWCTTGGTRPF